MLETPEQVQRLAEALPSPPASTTSGGFGGVTAMTTETSMTRERPMTGKEVAEAAFAARCGIRQERSDREIFSRLISHFGHRPIQIQEIVRNERANT